MKKLVLKTVAATSMTLSAAYAWACEGHAETAANQSVAPAVEKKEVAQVSVKDVSTMLSAKEVQPVDANGSELRAKIGVIPGATLLTSASRYELSELPADKTKKLVFYCANEQCSASHMAAKRAREAGYQDVAVMPAGIMGWKKAGKATAKAGQS